MFYAHKTIFLAHKNPSSSDEVYVSSGNKLNRDKLDEIRVGPFMICEKLSKTVNRLGKGNKKSEELNFHISKMVPKRDVIED